jgi:hypothetical protein
VILLALGLLACDKAGGESAAPSGDSVQAADSGAGDGGGDNGGDDGGGDDDEGSGDDGDSGAGAQNQAPVITAPGAQGVDEEQALTVTIDVSDPEGDALRVFLTGLPPGARWDEAARQLSFTPDFTQGGDAWTVEILADDGTQRASASFQVQVRDTISPPDPVVAYSEDFGAWTRLTLSQQTDDFLDSPGYAGRYFEAVVTVPNDGAASLPVRVSLHGYGGAPWTEGWEGEYRIMPHDPENTYWWGYSEELPGGEPVSGAVPDYTQRRVLHLLEWVLRSYPGADPERVYVEGASMGGAGAATFGLLHARHVAWVEATIGQAIPRNHRPSRIAQLSGLWGAPELSLDDGRGMAAWDRQDLTRALRELPEARDQLVFTKHGKDDPTIHFGAVVSDSPLTGVSWYEAVEAERVGHYAVWDEGGHGVPDPVLGDGWWHAGWNPIFDDTAWLRRSVAFPAFSGSSVNNDPGDGSGNGAVSWDDESGYAADVDTPGDCGWSGELAGALGRSLRWDAGSIVDTVDGFSIDLYALDGDGGDPPAEGYPTTGDKLDGALPVVVDVTPRRVQAFRALPGEPIDWTFGSQSGQVQASDDGSITVPALQLTTTTQTLALSRVSR